MFIYFASLVFSLLCLRDSTNQANVEVIPPQKDAQPEGSTVETTDDTKLVYESISLLTVTASKFENAECRDFYSYVFFA